MFSNRSHQLLLLLLLLLLLAQARGIVSFSDMLKSNVKVREHRISLSFPYQSTTTQQQNHTQSSSKLHHKHIKRLRSPLETRSVHGGVHPGCVVSEGAVAESSQEYFDALAAALL